MSWPQGAGKCQPTPQTLALMDEKNAAARAAAIEECAKALEHYSWKHKISMEEAVKTIRALSQAPATDGDKLPPDWKQDQAETSRLAPSHARPELGGAA